MPDALHAQPQPSPPPPRSRRCCVCGVVGTDGILSLGGWFVCRNCDSRIERVSGRRAGKIIAESLGALRTLEATEGKAGR